MERQLTMGSLFDGIGGFMLAAQACGITPVWAAEIEPNCISITRRHFPEVMHVGSVTELKGDEVPPVDIITFGSPCQNLSVAGNRKGLAGEESGLFLEAIRIIEEMRESTNGIYPAFIIWENVPGAFSSNDRQDFRTVLEKSQKPVFLCLNLNGPEPEWYEGEKLTQHGEHLMPSIGESPSVAVESTLSEILEDNVPERYSLSRRACWGILRRALKRKRKLPETLEMALMQRIQEDGRQDSYTGQGQRQGE